MHRSRRNPLLLFGCLVSFALIHTGCGAQFGKMAEVYRKCEALTEEQREAIDLFLTFTEALHDEGYPQSRAMADFLEVCITECESAPTCHDPSTCTRCLLAIVDAVYN